MPVVLYGCETWSPTLSEERRLRVFENLLLRRIFGTMRDKEPREWRKLHNEKLIGLYLSPNINRVIKSRKRYGWEIWVHKGERRGAYRVLEGRPEGKRPLGRPSSKWEDIRNGLGRHGLDVSGSE